MTRPTTPATPRRRTTLVLVALALVATVAGCGNVLGLGVGGSGQEATQRRDVAAFDRIDVRGQTDLTVAPGDTAVTVRGDDNLLDEVRTLVDGGTLVIDEARPLRPRAGLVVEVTMSELAGVTLQGSGDATVQDVIGEAFSTEISGSGEMTIAVADGTTFACELSGSGGLEVDDVDSETFTAAVRGSGELRASGQAERVDVTVSGSGGAQLEDLAARQVTVETSGSGDAAVRASDTLTASSSGSGSVTYAGDPATVDERSTGSGDVRPR